MTGFGYDALRDRLRDPKPEQRIVVTPILDPAQQLKKGQAAIDVRLGRSFALVRPWTHGVAEHYEFKNAGQGTAAEQPLERVVLDFGEPLIVHPHQFVLARTLEFVRLPADVMAYVIGRSSWGRRGLIVATAVVVHPGFAGPITLELKNVGEVPLALYPLDRVAQLAFHKVEGSPNDLITDSQFATHFSPTLGNVRDERTADVLAKLAKARRRS
jgi:dCTP deaminase